VILAQKPKSQEEKGLVERTRYLLLAVIGVITLMSYLNCIHNQFVFDDIPLILENPTIRGIEKVPQLLGLGKKRRISYRPVRMISYAADYTLNKMVWRHFGKYEGDDDGLNPLGYHLSNIAYHMVTSFLVFLVIYKLLANYRIAFLAASLFALHPVHTDSVSYLAGRRDILFTLFYLAGFYFFLCYRKTRKSTFIIASFLAYLLSLGSKEMAVTLPVLFLCYDLVEGFTGKIRGINITYFKEVTIALKKVLLQSSFLYSLVFLGALAYTCYKVFIKSPSHQASYYGDSMLTTFLTVGKILVYYMKLLLYPIKLNADYSYNAFPLSTSFIEPSTLFSFIFLGVVGYALLRLLVTHKMLAFGMIWFFVTLLPVCHIFPHHELLAEHYLYLPSFGFCLISALLLNNFLKKDGYVYLTYVSFIAIIFLFSFRIVDRNNDWRDKFTLWEKTVKTAPQCARAHSNICENYVEKGRLDEAISECKRALAINPYHAQAHNNLGTAYARNGSFNEAILEYKQAINIRPRYVKAHYNLGVAYFKVGKINEAIAEYKRALAIRPRYAEAHNNLGITYAKKGELPRAISKYKRALAIKPHYVDAHFNLGVAYDKNGDLDEAMVRYEQVLAIKPNYVEAHNNLGNAYYKKGELDKAILEYKQALTINPRYADVHFNLGLVYAKKGRVDEAITEYRKVLAIKPQNVRAHTSLGAAYHKKGEFDKAINEYKQALTFNHDYAVAHNNLAMVYFEEKQYFLAVKHCDRALKLGFQVDPTLLKNLLPYRNKIIK